MVEESKNPDVEDKILGEEEEDTQKDKYLTFRVSDEDYGIDIRYVRDIIRIQKVTEVPDTDAHLKGVINLRGKVIPVIDVRLRFSMEPMEYDDRTCIIVVNMNDVLTGLIVDRVSEVIDIPEKQVDDPPTSGSGRGNRFIKGMGKVDENVKMILDINRMLGDKAMEDLKTVSEENN